MYIIQLIRFLSLQAVEKDNRAFKRGDYLKKVQVPSVSFFNLYLLTFNMVHPY